MIDKKAMSQVWWVISAAVIAIIALIVIVVWFTDAGRELATGLGETIDNLDDYDSDGLTNLLDKCPCDDDPELTSDKCLTNKKECTKRIKEELNE
jgi:Sec-independent protein translocase protein TatA